MISIILPAFKSDYLAATIQCLLNQTYRDYELIIVNDNPGSSIRSIVTNFKDDRIKYYENVENIGGKNLILNWNNCLRRFYLLRMMIYMILIIFKQCLI